MKLLSVSDVAMRRKTGRRAASRWLERNASAFLLREGRFVRIAENDYERIAGPRKHADIERRVGDLEEHDREQDRRLDQHAKALASLHLL